MKNYKNYIYVADKNKPLLYLMLIFDKFPFITTSIISFTVFWLLTKLYFYVN